MKKPSPTTYPTDCDATRETLEWLKAASFRYDRPTPWQIKIRGTALSYYPRKGTIFRDGDPQALPHRGLDALATLLHGQRLQPTLTISGDLKLPDMD
jgi:hypothetical protein